MNFCSHQRTAWCPYSRFFFLFNFWRTHVHYRTIDTPILDFWWAALCALGEGICEIHSLRFTSGVIPLLVYSSLSLSLHAYCSRGRMLDLELLINLVVNAVEILTNHLKKLCSLEKYFLNKWVIFICLMMSNIYLWQLNTQDKINIDASYTVDQGVTLISFKQ